MEGLVIYKSSAGSGKTYTLVREYLQIVLEDPRNYAHVLAITFTNKATEEMKSRIIGALSQLAKSPADSQDDLYLSLKQYFEEKGKNIIIPYQAKKVLHAILNDYSNFSVSTIESFFQRIVRAFTRELNIPLGYDVEMQQDLVLERIVDEIFWEVGREKELTQLLDGFLSTKLEDEKGWNIGREIKALAREVFKEKFQHLAVDHPEDGEARIKRTLELAADLKKKRRIFEVQMNKWAEEAIGIMESHGLDRADFLYANAGVAGYFFKVRDKKDFEPGKRALLASEDPGKWYKKGAKNATQIDEALDAGLYRCLQDMIDLYRRDFSDYISAVQILRNLHSFGLMDQLQSKLAAYRKEHNQLIISDTSQLIQQIISHAGESFWADAPFIYEKVGNRYHYYLIDEFQDTSEMQWKNLRPLIFEALSNAFGGLVVGDVKQSIYRWRNGKMDLLMFIVQQQMGMFGHPMQEKYLRDNWRTAAQIVGFNNQFFEKSAEAVAGSLDGDPEAEIIRAAYLGVGQDARVADKAGAVELALFPDRNFRDKSDQPRWQDLALAYSLKTVEKLLAPEMGYKGGDICMLVRRNQEGMILAEYLQEHGLKVISAESLLVASDPKVHFLLALLKNLQSESDEVVQASLRYYHQLLSPKENSSFHAVLQSDGPVSEAFEARKAALRQLPVYECIEQLGRLFPALRTPNAYVQGFMDAVLEYSQSNDASIDGFLTWWDEQAHKRAIATAPDPESIQIMTIHKAKGLEFPVVMIPFADWDMKPSSRAFLWIQEPQQAPYDRFAYLPVSVSKKLSDSYFSEHYTEEKRLSYLDNLNLLYVAMTRAQYRLYVFSRDSKTKSSINRISDLIKRVIPTLDGIEINKLEDPHRYIIGELGSPRPSTKSASTSTPTSVLNLQTNAESHHNWNRAVRIRFSANRYLKTDQLEQAQKISSGTLMHLALSYIEKAADLDKAVQKLHFQGYLTSEEQVDFRSHLFKLMAHPQARDWFAGDWEVRNESEILNPDGPLRVLRPDRVMLKGEKAIIVDYKTGQEAERYHKQIRIYMEVMQKLGYVETQGYIYYLSHGLIIPVSL